MPLYFWFNNSHFALEFLGALVFLALGWLAFDALRARFDIKSVVKGTGFTMIAAWQVIHALDVTENIPLFAGLGMQIAGLLFVLASLLLEKPPPRPTFAPAVVVLPAATALSGEVNLAAAALAIGIALVAAFRYKTERNRVMIAIGFGFLLLSLSFVAARFADERIDLSLFWIAEHAVKLLGFLLLSVWLWQFLHTRVLEQLFIIFVLLAGVIGILVTFSFSAAMLAQMQRLTKSNLAAAARSQGALLEQAAQIAKDEIELLGRNAALARALEKRSPGEAERIGRAAVEAAKLDFLIVAEPAGVVLAKTHALTLRDETILHDDLFRQAKDAPAGAAVFDIADVDPEGLSLRAAVELSSGNLPVGVIVGGYILDEVFAKRMSAILGHEAAFYGSRSAELLGAEAVKSVFEEGKPFAGNVERENRPYTAYVSPVKNKSGSVAGAAMVAQEQIVLSRLATATNRLTLLTSLAVLLLVLMPVEHLLKRLLANR